jgi:hypothetical protein
MTLEEFEEYRDKELSEARKDFKKAVAMWNKKQEIEDKYLLHTTLISEDINGRTPEEVIEVINEFYKEVSELPYHVDGSYQKLDIKTDYDSSEIYNDFFIYSYKTISTIERIEERVKTNVRTWFRKELKPDSEKYEQSVDCKLMELFKNGTIDFKTIQSLVYKNCVL